MLLGHHANKEKHLRHYQDMIFEYSDDDILTVPTEDIVDVIYEVLHIPSVKIDNNGLSLTPRQINAYNHPSNGLIRVDADVFEVEFHYTGASGLFRHCPAKHDAAPPRAWLKKGSNQGSITIAVVGSDLTEEIVKAEIARDLASIDCFVKWQELEIEPFNSTLRDRIRSSIATRKDRILKARGIAASLGYRMQCRDGAPTTYISPVVRRRITQQMAATEAFRPEPVMGEEDYENILSIIERMTFVMERSPSVFSKMPEEALRDNYLVQLNGQYESVTGETFNAYGKTDILVRDGVCNLFVAECKIWRGPKIVGNALDQLLSYLTWRDTKAALLIFSRNKDFTGMLVSLWGAVQDHPQLKRGPSFDSETRARYVFGRADDPNREIILTVMAFAVPANNPSLGDHRVISLARGGLGKCQLSSWSARQS